VLGDLYIFLLIVSWWSCNLLGRFIGIGTAVIQGIKIGKNGQL
jgi:presenilin-like A22 family membrane protease